MRCQEVLDQLPLLAYNELDDVSAARCQEHLAGCAACQAEWKSTQGALRLLDLVPRQHTQVDLAAVCLRIAREQRHGRVVARWAIGVAAAAAIVVGVVGTQLLAVNVEPGRLIVAWNAEPAPAPVEDGKPLDPGAAGNRVESPEPGGSGAGQATQSVADGDFAPNALVLLLEGDRPLAWQRRRASLSMEDVDRNLAFESMPPPRQDRLGTVPKRPASYSDLRFQWIEDQQQSPARVKTPGA